VILLGDSLLRLRELPENSVDAVVTDPPWALKFMNKKWDYNLPSREIWLEVIRVLKPGGHALICCGTRTQHRMVVNVEDAGFEIRDVVTHLYGSGFPKSHNLKDEWSGWGTALKPACEFWTLARKPLSEKTVAQNVLKWGCGAINVDGSRIGTTVETWPKTRAVPKSGRNMEFGSIDKETRTAETGESPQGRWPANALFDEEAAAVLDEQSGVCKSAGKYKDNKLDTFKPDKALFKVGYQTNKYAGDSGGASRFFYVAKASKRERNAGLEGMALHASGHKANRRCEICGMQESSGSPCKCLAPRFVEVPLKPQQNFHPTVKPIRLMQYLCRLITPPGGTILDPFMGSGSTGVAAKSLGFEFIGIELSEEYFKIAERRIDAQASCARG
jgi:DNA modification methylase